MIMITWQNFEQEIRFANPRDVFNLLTEAVNERVRYAGGRQPEPLPAFEVLELISYTKINSIYKRLLDKISAYLHPVQFLEQDILHLMTAAEAYELIDTGDGLTAPLQPDLLTPKFDLKFAVTAYRLLNLMRFRTYLTTGMLWRYNTRLRAAAWTGNRQAYTQQHQSYATRTPETPPPDREAAVALVNETYAGLSVPFEGVEGISGANYLYFSGELGSRAPDGWGPVGTYPRKYRLHAESATASNPAAAALYVRPCIPAATVTKWQNDTQLETIELPAEILPRFYLPVGGNAVVKCQDYQLEPPDLAYDAEGKLSDLYAKITGTSLKGYPPPDTPDTPDTCGDIAVIDYNTIFINHAEETEPGVEHV